MFLGMLTTEQQNAFCQVAVYIMRASGVVDQRETNFLEAAMQEMGVESLPPPPSSLEEVLAAVKVYDSLVAVNILMVEAVGVSAADGAFQPEEMRIIEAIGDALNYDRAKIDRCKAFARKAHELMEEGRLLVAEV